MLPFCLINLISLYIINVQYINKFGTTFPVNKVGCALCISRYFQFHNSIDTCFPRYKFTFFGNDLKMILNIFNVGFTQVGSTQVGFTQVGSTQVGSIQVGFTQVGSTQVGSTQVGSTQVGSYR